MKRHITERIIIELGVAGYACQGGFRSDIDVYRGERADGTQDPIAAVRIVESDRSVRVWVPPDKANFKEEILRTIARAVRPDGWSLQEAATREEASVDPDWQGATPPSAEPPSDPGSSIWPRRRRFRAARYLVLFAYLLLALFFGMLLNLRTPGWIGTAILLILTGVLSGKVSSKGCLPTLLIWFAGLLCILVVFALTIQI